MAISTLLTDDSLDFSRRHLTAYYDTDFFPKPFEFGAIWYKWDELKSVNRDSLASLISPVAIPWKKSRGSYRIVHQLDPLDSVCYTAAVHNVAQKVEELREFRKEACSYRISLDGTGFFRSGSGFDRYRTRCEELAEHHKYVLATDISDFYNQIYLHRLGNAISTAVDNDAGKSIEVFLTALNSRNSQGLPVGPAASIILSEAALIDVDQFIFDHGFRHARYVDDIRIFGDSASQLDELLQRLTLYLHQTHRLGLVGDKTKIIESEKFLQTELNNQYQLEKLEILEEIEVINPYSHEAVEENSEVPSDAGEKLLDALVRISKYDFLDLGVARAIIRRARANKLPDIADYLLTHNSYFRPVVNDVVLYLEAISTQEFLGQIRNKLVDMSLVGELDDYASKEWYAWYISNHRYLLNSNELRKFVGSTQRLSYSAKAAVTLKNVSWVRGNKDLLLNSATWNRRAIIYAAQLLSEDEKSHWLKPLKNNNSFSLLDRWMIDWVLNGTPAVEPLPIPAMYTEGVLSGFDDFEDDIPF